jgi:hypothetical protein
MAHERLWEQLEKLDRIKTVQRARCQYLSNPERYIITMLNNEYIINLSDRNIFSRENSNREEPVGFLEQLCILAYLINAQDIPLAGKLVGAETLPGGQFFFRGSHSSGLHSLPTEKLEKAFGDHPEVLYQASARFGAEQCEFGDTSVRLNVLPSIPLTIVIWRRDEEFDARASILFDQTATSHLPLDALSAAVNLTVEALVKSATDGGQTVAKN